MKKIIICISALLFHFGAYTQCHAYMDDTVRQFCHNIPSNPFTYSGEISVDPADPNWLQNGYTFSWSPTTGLDDPHSYMPIVTRTQGYWTYTCTVTGPGCGTYVAGHTVFAGFPVVVSPSGPINYYNHYENTDSITLTSTFGGKPWGFQWVKNGVALPGYSDSYKIKFSGDTSYTDTYKATTDCVETFFTYQTSNSVTFHYIGCTADGDYPVGITHGGCASTLASPNYIQVNAPSLGTGTVYNYWIRNNPTCFAVSSAGHLTASGCYNGQGDGLYVKSSKNGAETYMFNYIFANTGCRTANNSAEETVHNNSEVLIAKVTIFPNPSRQQITVKSKDEIQRIEFYNVLGVCAKKVNVNNGKMLRINTNDLTPGTYNCKIITVNGNENVKLVIQ